MSAASTHELGDRLQSHARYLWAICYRMTGSAAEAEELVQETFARVLASPQTLREPLKPFLSRVAVNLATDALRRRKSAPYVGTWLPSPIETGEEATPPSFEPESTDGRYDLLESVSMAFLIALEALSPLQRAVLLLRDVFDYSVRETAEALDVSEPNVKTTHHRARAAMSAYDQSRTVPTEALQTKTRVALESFFTSLAAGDVGQIEALLAQDVRALSDGGGEFFANKIVIVGRERVMTFFKRLVELRSLPQWFEIRSINGLPAILVRYANPKPGEAPCVLMQLELGTDGKIKTMHTVLAPRKLAAVTFG